MWISTREVPRVFRAAIPRLRPGRREGHALRAVFVAGQRSQFLEFVDGSFRIQRHRLHFATMCPASASLFPWERRRLACLASASRRGELFARRPKRKDCFGETPKPARETRALPRARWKRLSGEHRLPACSRRQLAYESRSHDFNPRISAGSRNQQAGSLCSPELMITRRYSAIRRVSFKLIASTIPDLAISIGSAQADQRAHFCLISEMIAAFSSPTSSLHSLRSGPACKGLSPVPRKSIRLSSWPWLSSS